MEKDPSLPPNRSRPTGRNQRLRAPGENRPRRDAAPAGSGGTGFATGWLLAALGVGLALAYVSTAEANPGPNGGAAPGPETPGSDWPAPTPGSSTPGSPAPAGKPPRRAVVPPATPLTYVYIDSFGGEGVFDKLKNSDSLLDGHGLDRVATLSNGEFAGFATGKTWAGPRQVDGAVPTYLQLYMLVAGVRYNFWVDSWQVKQFHQAGSAAYEASGKGTNMSLTTKQLIVNWYQTHYA